MNKTLRTVLMALSLLALSNVALAGEGRGHGHDRDHDRRGHGYSYDRGYHGGPVYRDEGRYRMVRHGDRHGPRGGHHWKRGYRYDRPIYVVRDYRHYHLHQPPRGYGWVRGGNNDYLLVALATGIIMDIALR